MHHWLRRSLTLVAISGAVAVVTPTTAHAQFYSEGSVLIVAGLTLVGAGAAGAVLALDLTDVLSYAHGQPQRDDWAALDLVLGSAMLVASGVTISLMVQPNDSFFRDANVQLGFGIGTAFVAASGLHLLIHGIWSFTAQPGGRSTVEVGIGANGFHVAGSF